MTAYCTPQDLIDRFGVAELAQLAPATPGPVDTAKVQRACDDAGDMVAIFEKFGFAARREAFRIHRKALDQVARPFWRDVALRSDKGQRIERRVAGFFACQGPFSCLAQIGKPGLGVFHPAQSTAMILPIGDIVALAAPAIEQPRPLPRVGRKQLGRHRKRTRAKRDAVPRLHDKRRAIRRGGAQRSSTFIARIVWCGTCAAIRASSRSRSSSEIRISLC